MDIFIVETPDNLRIRFLFYKENAPVTSAAFAKLLPFTRLFLHARISGQEIWTDSAPKIDIIQENASVFTLPGEIVIGPNTPLRNKIINCIGIFYGPGQLLDAGNIFGKVHDDDLSLLQKFGDEIWRNGGKEIIFKA